MPTKIPWATETWNPFHGCTPVSAGCLNCWAKPMAKRLQAMGTPGYEDGFKVTLHPHKLDEPYHWRKPRLVFAGSMGDMFHKGIPTTYIERMFHVMEDCPQHIFQVLTKRPERMTGHMMRHDWPTNVWLGTSVEDCSVAADRLKYLSPDGTIHLGNEPRKFISYEPALGPIDIRGWHRCCNWLIVGCESGPKRRLFRNEWPVSVIAGCRACGIPVFVKQIIVNGKVSKDPSEWPEELQVQEYPEAMRRVLGASG